ncbi:carbohydrate ABC transporter permease [Paenibacillus sp. HB172176]|uniref:carbohydrate ABC transporter permease n=1 Tax=Paenibacillus sp. HB172176 TaxID=2493690 RepID=UPI00143ACFA3|nr:carbohydrate ABC transporter permease [Paenibacillus sp. HB172176]
MNGNRIAARIAEVSLWLLALLIFVPLYFVFVNSLKSSAEVQTMTLALPSVFHFDNYAKVFQNGNMPRAFLNSFIYTTGATTITCILASLASYIMIRRRSLLNRILFNLFVIGMIAPMNMVTTFHFIKSLHLINTYTGLILLYTSQLMPFTIFLYNGFIGGMPRELDEASTIDGAGPLRRFFFIIFPLLKPVTVTALIINFVNCWNDFIIPLYLITQTNKWGIVLLLFQYTGQFSNHNELLLAGAMLVAVPTLVLYAIGQRYIISGMTSGAIKG